MGVNILSLFDGMGGLMIALKTLGVEVDNYYSSEIDKFAIAQTKLNFPNVIHLGSVTDIKAIDLKKIDLIAFGSPCQGFSYAGKQLNFSDPRSALFFEAVRLVNECKAINPDVLFLMENVDMPKKWIRIISEHLGIFPVNINSNLVSAQNRNRWYWTNIKTKKEGLFGENYTDIPQPKDKGILLRDVLDGDVDEKYYLIDKMLTYFSSRAANFNAGKVNIRPETGKASTMCASMSSCDISDNFILGTNLKPKENQLKSGCLTAGGHSGGLHSDMDLIVTPCDYRRDEGIREKKSGKTGTLLSRARNDESCGQLAKIGSKIRRLTPTECASLQTIPDWYKWDCSDTQQYKMLGNGWTNDVIVHILSFANFEKC